MFSSNNKFQNSLLHPSAIFLSLDYPQFSFEYVFGSQQKAWWVQSKCTISLTRTLSWALALFHLRLTVVLVLDYHRLNLTTLNLGTFYNKLFP